MKSKINATAMIPITLASSIWPPEIARVDCACLAPRPDLFVAPPSRATQPARSSPLDLGASCVAIHSQLWRSLWSRVLQHHALDDVGDVEALVGGRLDQVVDLFPLHHREWVPAALEQAAEAGAERLVALGLDLLHLSAA